MGGWLWMTWVRETKSFRTLKMEGTSEWDSRAVLS